MSVTQEIRVNGKIVEAGVTKPETYGPSVSKIFKATRLDSPYIDDVQGRAVIGGLNDPRLGDTKNMGNIDENPGYFGHIEVSMLKIPLFKYHPLLISVSTSDVSHWIFE